MTPFETLYIIVYEAIEECLRWFLLRVFSVQFCVGKGWRIKSAEILRGIPTSVS
jgi:hypothetical protein